MAHPHLFRCSRGLADAHNSRDEIRAGCISLKVRRSTFVKGADYNSADLRFFQQMTFPV